MAHKKAAGSSRNGRDSNPKMLGVKIFGGQAIVAGINQQWQQCATFFITRLVVICNHYYACHTRL